MSINQRELELKERIIRNTTKSLMWADNQKREEKVALVDFMKEIGKVFIFIVGGNKKDIVLTYVPEALNERRQELLTQEKLSLKEKEELNRLETTLYVNISFLISAEDATPRASFDGKALLSFWVNILIDRLRSRTRNKRTISLIITELFVQFMQCYSEHRRKTYAIYDLLMLSVESMSTEASHALMSFLETDAANVFRDAKVKAKEGLKKKNKIQAI